MSLSNFKCLSFKEYQCFYELNTTSTKDYIEKSSNLAFFNGKEYVKGDIIKNATCGVEYFGLNNIDSSSKIKIQYSLQYFTFQYQLYNIIFRNKKGYNEHVLQANLILQLSGTDKLSGSNNPIYISDTEQFECSTQPLKCSEQMYLFQCTVFGEYFIDQIQMNVTFKMADALKIKYLYLVNYTAITYSLCKDIQDFGYCDISGIQTCYSNFELKSQNGINICQYKKSNCQKGETVLKSQVGCMKCHSSCQVCDDDIGCICQQNQFFKSFSNNNQDYVGCLDCMDNCLKCKSIYDCMQCKKGFYFDYQITKCIKCNLVNCDECHDLNICIACSKGYSVENGQCVSNNQIQQTNSSNQAPTIQQKGQTQFYQYCLFWVFIYQTIFQIFFQIYVFYLDKQQNTFTKQQLKNQTNRDINDGKLNVRQLSQIPLNQVGDERFLKTKQKSTSLQIEQQQQKQTHQQENLQTQFQENMQTEQVATENYFDQIQNKIDLEKQYQQTNIQEQVTKLNIDNQSNLVLQSKDSKINIDVLGGKNRKQQIQEENQNELQGQQRIDQSTSQADNDNYKEQQNKFMMQNCLLKLLYFHNFISIFLVFDSKIPRMQRSSIFYLRVIHALSISSVFGQYHSSEKMILICFVSSIIVAICIPIAKLIYSIKAVGQYIYTGIFLGLLTYYMFIISLILAGKNSSYTDDIIGWFFIMLIFDLILVSGIQAMFQLALVNHMISNNHPKNSRIQILFYFLKLQDILRNINL